MNGLLRSGLNVTSFGEMKPVKCTSSIIRAVSTESVSKSTTGKYPFDAHSVIDAFRSIYIVIDPHQWRIGFRAGNLDPAWVDGLVRASMNLNLSSGGVFQTDDVLGSLSLPFGSFGPITIDSASGLPLTVVSEVRSTNGQRGSMGVEAARKLPLYG